MTNNHIPLVMSEPLNSRPPWTMQKIHEIAWSDLKRTKVQCWKNKTLIVLNDAQFMYYFLSDGFRIASVFFLAVVETPRAPVASWFGFVNTQHLPFILSQRGKTSEKPHERVSPLTLRHKNKHRPTCLSLISRRAVLNKMILEKFRLRSTQRTIYLNDTMCIVILANQNRGTMRGRV